MNVYDILVRASSRRPQHTAVIFGERRITYLELREMTSRFASGLQSLDIGPKDVLSIFLPSVPELLVAYLGAASAGVTVNLVNAMLMETEVSYILKDCKSKAVLTDRKRLPIVEAAASKGIDIETIILLEGKSGGAVSFESLLSKGQRDFVGPPVKGSDLCHLMYTSGTTGWPKGVMATHLNISHHAVSFGKVHYGPDDTIMVAAPIFHCWGLVNGTLGMFSREGTVITVERFNPSQALKDIEALKPTVFMGVPPMYNLMLKEPDLSQRNVSSVVFCLSAATKMPESLIHQVQERLGWRYAEAWGLTEISCVGATAP